jgi:hypothetical protein
LRTSDNVQEFTLYCPSYRGEHGESIGGPIDPYKAFGPEVQRMAGVGIMPFDHADEIRHFIDRIAKWVSSCVWLDGSIRFASLKVLKIDFADDFALSCGGLERGNCHRIAEDVMKPS